VISLAPRVNKRRTAARVPRRTLHSADKKSRPGRYKAELEAVVVGWKLAFDLEIGMICIW
jgi:hypothetical protein